MKSMANSYNNTSKDMNTVHSATFVAFKRWMAGPADRNALKRRLHLPRLPSIHAHEIALANGQAVVAQDGVGGRHVEEELRQTIVRQVGLPIEIGRASCRERVSFLV